MVSFAGIRLISLLGYGIVVGLDGTGDSSLNLTSTKHAINNFSIWMSCINGDLSAKNSAAVMITAELNPFAKSRTTNWYNCFFNG